MRKSALKPGAAGADHPVMRATILGAFGVLWGGAIIASGILNGRFGAGPSYAAGEALALAVGALLVLAGTRALVRQR
jgi:hypothetical protein